MNNLSTYMNRLIVLLVIFVMGASSAWAQTFSKWDGTNPTETWDAANIAASGITGAGTEGDPYVIHDAKGFVYFWWGADNGKIGSSTQYWKLDVDIDLDNKPWPYVNKNGTFKGKFDGQDHTISNMKLVPPTKNLNYGLFCLIEGQAEDNRAEIKNLTISNSTIAPNADLDGNTTVGFVVGKINKNTDITNVKVINCAINYEKNIGGNQYVGGVIGQVGGASTTVANCSVSTLAITSNGTTTNAYFGGLIGHVNAQTAVASCSTDDVTITYNKIANASRISGFIGYAKGAAGAPTTISSCSVANTTIDLKAGINNGSFIGVLLAQGDAGTEISSSNSISTSKIQIDGEVKAATNYIGGAIGNLTGGATVPSKATGVTIDNSDITLGTSSNGIVGVRAGVIGQVSKNVLLKDLTVNGNSKITVNGNLITTETRLGGLIGYLETDTNAPVSISNANISGNSEISVTGKFSKASQLGGLIGYVNPGDKDNAGVSIQGSNISGDVSIKVGGNIEAGSHLGGYIGYVQGRAKSNSSTIIDGVNLKNPNISVGGNITAGSYLGGVAGYVTTSCQFNTVSVDSPAISVNGNITTASSYIGGAIGDFLGNSADDGNSSIDVFTVKSPSVVINKVSYKECRIGAVFGRIYNYSEIKNVTVESPSLKYDDTDSPNVDLRLGTFAGEIVGNAIRKTSVTSVTMSDATMVIGMGTQNVANVKAGAVGRTNTNVLYQDWTIAGSTIDVKGNIANAGCQIGTFAGSVEGTGGTTIAPVTFGTIGHGITVKGNNTVSVSGNIIKTSYIGGFIGQLGVNDALDARVFVADIDMSDATTKVIIGGDITTETSYLAGFAASVQAKNSADKGDQYISFDNVTLGKTDISVSNIKNKACYIGGLFGQAKNSCRLSNLSINNPTISVNDVGVASYIGGAFGDFEGAAKVADIINLSTVKTLTVTNPSIFVNNYSAGPSLTGGVFGRVSTYTAVDGVDLKGASFTFINDLGVAQQIGTFAGTITGNATQQISVKNVTIDKSDLTFGTSNTSNTVGLKVGIIGQVSTNVLLDTWTVTGDSKITVNGNLITTGSQIGGFIGNLATDTSAPVSVSNVNISGKSEISVLGRFATKGSQLGGLIGYVNPGDKDNAGVSIQGSNISGDVSIKVDGNIEAGSHLGGYIGYVQGRAKTNSSTIIVGVTLKNPNISVGGNITAGSYLGGVAGYVTTSCQLNTVSVDSPAISVNGNIGAASYIGGAIGDFVGANGYNSTIKDLTVTNSSISINNYSAGTSLTGGVFGRVNTYTAIDGVNVTDANLSFPNNIAVAQQIGTFAGTITGNVSAQTSVKNVTVENSNITFDGDVISPSVGGFVGLVNSYSLLDNVKVNNAELVFKGVVKTSGFVGGAIGDIVGTSLPAMAKINDVAVTNSSITFAAGAGNVGSNNLFAFGGVVGRFRNYTAADNISSTRTKVLYEGTVGDPVNLGGAVGCIDGGDPLAYIQNTVCSHDTIIVNGDQTASTLYLGGFAGNITNSYITDANISNEEIVLNGNHVNVMAVGGAFGRLAANSTLENVNVQGVIRTEGDGHTVASGNKALSVGGVIGIMEADPITVNGCASNVDINLGGFTPATSEPQYNLQQNAFVVGGVIGRFNNAIAILPKNLIYSGKIYAPIAAVAPIVGCFVVDVSKSVYVYDDYSGETRTSWDDANTWFYSEYKLGLSQNLIDLDNRTKNYYDADCEVIGGITYLVIKEPATTFKEGNSIAGISKASRTVLAYTQNNKNQDMGIYPQWTSNSATYPAYYMYYMQGVNRGTYSSSSMLAYIKQSDESEKYEVVTSSGRQDYYYVWYVNDAKYGDGNDFQNLIASVGNELNVYVEIYENESDASDPAKILAKTDVFVIKPVLFVQISSPSAGNYYISYADENGNEYTFDSHYSFEYHWFVGDKTDGSDAEEQTGLDGRQETIDLSVTEGKKYVLCQVIIKYDEEPVYDKLQVYFVNGNHPVRVVYLQLPKSISVTASNGVTYYAKNAGVNDVGHQTYDAAIYGLTPEKPVNSWAGAYELLNGYTEPSQEYVTSHGGTWTSATVYDVEVSYLNNKGDYPYDVYKRDGNKRKVKDEKDCAINCESNIIVLMGLSNDGYFNAGESNQHNVDGARANKPVTITGMYNGTNYYGYLSNTSGDFSINADHKFENMGFGVSDKGIGATESIRYRIYAHRWNIYAGKGLLMGWAAALEWGPSIVPVTDTNKKYYKTTRADISTGTPVGEYGADIAIMGGYLNDNTSTNPEMFEYINHGRDDSGQQVKIESGFWGPVCPGNRQTDSGNTINTYYVMGGPEYPAKTVITIDIDREWNDKENHNMYNSAMTPATVDVGCLLSGNHEGTMYADVTLNIVKGRIGRVVNGIKGSQRRANDKPKDSFKTEGHFRHVLYDSSNNLVEVSTPCPDSYFGRGVINITPENDEDVSIVELYCGGLGRAHNDGSYHPEVCTYFYGLSEVNIYGGKFSQTIYGSGAGGVNGIGYDAYHTDDNALPYWNTDLEDEINLPHGQKGTNHVWYAPYDYIKKVGRGENRNGNKYNFVKVKASPAVIDGKGNSYPDTNLKDGYVNLERTQNIINIYGGKFGSESNPASIYGGGFGEINAALINPASVQSDKDIKNIYNTPNHQGGNIFGDPTKDYFVTQINIQGEAVIWGNIYGGGKGSSRLYRFFTRAANPSYTNAFQGYCLYVASNYVTDDGGVGGDANYSAQTNGDEWKTIQNIRQNADNYLNLGQVIGNTKIEISGNAQIHGNVYGGGEGVKDESIDAFLTDADPEYKIDDMPKTTLDDLLKKKGTASNGKRTAYIKEGDSFVSFPEMGKTFGKAKVIIRGSAYIDGSVYGGGQAGAMTGDSTSVCIKDAAHVTHNVYGASEGVAKDKSKDYEKVACIEGTTNILISGNAKIDGNVYGGGEKAVVKGNTNVTVEGNVSVGTEEGGGDLFGGGQGLVDGDGNLTNAYVSGDTNVKIQ